MKEISLAIAEVDPIFFAKNVQHFPALEEMHLLDISLKIMKIDPINVFTLIEQFPFKEEGSLKNLRRQSRGFSRAN